MGAQQRVYRQRIRSVQATKKITRAMELIAASRVVKAREAVAKSTPYAVALTRAVSSVASSTSDIDHALTTERENVKRAGVLIVTADRGLAGSYSVNAMKEAQQLITKLEHEGKEVVPYLVGRKGVSYYKFRRREYEAEWTGFTDSPKFENAEEIGERLTADFHAGAEGGGVDELHVVYTEFQSMVTQQARVIRLLPLEVAEGQLDLDGDGKPDGPLPLYDFEPNAEGVLDALLPKYVTARIFNALLQSAASELAARQRAMKSATDNATELIKTYTRLANQARQAEITQEISEIVGGASALADAS
ncbi:F0F1 ATP synthase subunit gamma [Dermacoccus nishinomiyaensis]|uniref:ATP synthase gamma chain n=1 Tax=Dermacoccus nishinomiyaensis TaxID=1274 RepID=A0A075JF17_9MICO|nr:MULTISPECIES: F0F1 ATP synthase subunit gamma [Dermacoccus]HCQ18787.1 F0F1 ATP synthase subunit gamma [Dermacoccus sp.]AIF40385.1 ATP synthase F0F1 subunit gamma [Dermacoccus nishinomiyaensis]EFP57806.1 ATP synthase F1, gamma subunit [Dermacoccus sp. Ellin185]MCG7429256.1 F0F1 ATP synthase subunit gamma [Dermacoccus nishinomiyaensis]MCI0154200.1 F0F1 ATP synthase subunit gamma [Dermacoccus nishinomiyaensis]